MSSASGPCALALSHIQALGPELQIGRDLGVFESEPLSLKGLVGKLIGLRK